MSNIGKSAESTCARCGRGSLHEFAPAIFILLLLFLVPLLDLAGLAVGYGTVFFICLQSASTASTQTNFDGSLNALERCAGTLNQSGLARFSRLQPVAGYRGLGSDIFIDVTNWRAGHTSASFGPNTPIPPPIDVSTNMYQFNVRSTYDVGPLLAISGLPVLGDVPGLGRPARITVAVQRQAEYPLGLAGSGNPTSSSQANNTLAFNSNAGGSPSTPGQLAGWNYPTIYEDIRAAGQVVLKESVLQCDAKSFDWTATDINYSPGDKLWFDFRADGMWSASVQQYGYYDAGGDAAGGDLIGKVGGTANPAANDGSEFHIGKRLVNYQPAGSGMVYLRIGDRKDDPVYFTDNDGLMTVRVVLTR